MWPSGSVWIPADGPDSGCQLGGPAGERLELLAQFDRLLHGRLLRAPQIRQGTAIMDGLEGLERHQHKERHRDKNNR